MEQKFIVTKKKDIAERNEHEFEENRIKEEKYKAVNIQYRQNFSKPKKKKNKKPQETPFKYTVEDIEKFIDLKSNQIPLKVRKALKTMKPKVFSPNDDSFKMIKDWKTRWKKRPHLSDKDYKKLCDIFEAENKKLERHRMINDMVDKANIHNAEYPHKKFCMKIAKVNGVVLDKIEIEANNDTTVYFKYKGNDVKAVCYGEPFEDNKKYLPTKMIVNGEEFDVSKKNINSCIKEIKPKIKKVIVIKKKKNSVK